MYVKSLTLLKQQISDLDFSVGTSINNYFSVFEQLKTLNLSFSKKHVIQTDAFLSANTVSLSKDIKRTLHKALTICNTLTPKSKDYFLTKFKTAFLARYEDTEIPLVEALDTETGIGYGHKRPEDSSLINELGLPHSKHETTQYKWSKIDDYLLERIYISLSNNNKTIELSDDFISSLSVDWTDLPDTISAMVEVIDNDGKLFFNGASGASAANLLARFGEGDNLIKEHTQKIVDDEVLMAKDFILAEIIHIPQARAGNILKHPPYRFYEIPYLGTSSLPKEQQIEINDIMVSVKNDTIFLRSKRLNKFILPRITNAHNYSANSLPVYHFLCDLQAQNKRDYIGFDFHPILKKMPFLPRVEYQNIILFKACWKISTESIETLLDWKSPNFEEQVSLWTKKLKLPQYVQLVEGDNKLLINTYNITCLKMLFNTIKKKTVFVLEEFLQSSNNIVKQKTNSFCNEIIVSFYNNDKLQKSHEL